MQPRRRFAIVAVTALVAAGGAAAIAATGEDDRREQAEDAILDDAADRLDVEPGELRSALSEAKLAQIDKAVEEGLISEEHAARIKEHMQESDSVFGFGGGPPGGPPRFHGPTGPRGPMAPGPGGPEVLDAIAEELGIPVKRLRRAARRAMKSHLERRGFDRPPGPGFGPGAFVPSRPGA